MSLYSRQLIDLPKSCVSPSMGDLDLSPEGIYTHTTYYDFEEDIYDDPEIIAAQSQVLKNTILENDYIPIRAERYVQSLIDLNPQKVIKPIAITKKYTIQERIHHIHNGNHVLYCISSPSQDFTKGATELQTKDDPFNHNIVNNYKKLDDGSLEMVNSWLLKKQKQVLGYLIKQFGSAIVSGKSIMSISLPISIFEPRSLLERLAGSFVFAPYYLEKAGQTQDTLEQFKNALTFYLTTLTSDLNPEKPFNPILGETFQGIIGGCPVYLEQISHHPPIAAFQMIGKNFTIEGSFEFHASISTNSVKCRKIGDFRVKFKNTGAIIQVQFPIGIMSGTAFGKRTYQCSKKLQVYDLKNNYYAEIDFDKTESANKKRGIAGFFSSNIHKISDKFALKIKQDSKKEKEFEIKFKEKEHSVTKLDQFEGSWLESLTINNKVYWSFGNPWPHKLQHSDNPLPSDCNFRADLLHLKCGDEMKAQDFKVVLEEAQRKDRKLREQAKSKLLK